jgi:hypothetical protein
VFAAMDGVGQGKPAGHCYVGAKSNPANGAAAAEIAGLAWQLNH